MFIKRMALLVLGAAMLVSCRPTPLDIDIPQDAGEITISSMVPNDKSIFVAAGYSIDAHINLEDSTSRSSAQGAMLIDSGIVTISAGGDIPDTLRRYASGIYGRTDLRLKPNVQYTLTVTDLKKGTATTATTVYNPQPVVDSLVPQVIRTSADTTIRLHIKLSNVKPGDKYFVCYNKGGIRNVAGAVISLTNIQSYEPKQIELISGEDAVNGILRRSLPLALEHADTVMVQVGKIDDGYFRYLDAYKRSGFLINQLTGEPINLPSNVAKGYGYFALFRPVYTTFYLNRY